MDMSALRTDVAPSIEVSDFFTHEPLYFDVMANTERIEKCTTCMESEDLLDILDEILITLEDVNAEVANTPERLRLVNLVQWTALKCSRSLTRFAAEAELAKRQPASPQKDVPSKKQAKSERKLPHTSTSPRHIEDAASSMEEGESTAEESSEEVGSAKSAKPVVAPSSSASKAAESASAPGTSQKDDGFTTVGRNGKRIAPIMIDAQSNATELLTQIGNLCNNTSLEGRFENGKLRVFPTSAEEHHIIQKFVSDKKMRSHTFEMAHNKQLKVVLKGLPTDYNQEEPMSELHTLGFKPNHISLLRNRKTNTNMPLFLVTLLRNPENKGGHLTSECTKSAKAPAKCANCRGPHPENFSGCPKNPINTKTTKTKATKNVWQERAAARKQSQKQTKPSFAEIVKGSNNNSLDAKEVITKMAQMMSQWGDMLSLLQSKL
ncbi:uncharacterized protein TNCV_75731 [Trichonephila clavipes]|nr:uncharacterized protein TNCV_75731 [Trichonephila clavipes]